MNDQVSDAVSQVPSPAREASHGRLAVAHVHTNLVGSGGDKVSELEAHYIARRGHKVSVIGRASPEIALRPAADGIEIVSNPAETRSATTVLAQTGHLDIVHCHCILSSPFAADLAEASGAALVIHNHSMGEAWWECTDIFSRMRSDRRELRSEVDQAVASADRVLCVSQAVFDHMRKLGLRTERALIMSNPIDNVFFREISQTGKQYDVAILARPSRAKSPFTALRILAAATRLRPGLRMIWMGRLGRWGPIMRTCVKLLGLRGLTFAGDLPPAQVSNVLDATNVLLSASNREGQPLSVLEALVRQCSALLSDIPSHRPFAQELGVRLFPRGNPKQAGHILIHLLDDHIRRARPNLACHRIEAHGERLLSIYEELMLERAAKIGPAV